MEKNTRGLFLLLAMISLGGCSTTQALPLTAFGALPATTIMAEAPSGFASFCIRFADQCRAQQGRDGPLTLDAKSWHLLTSVNQSVNDAIWPQKDSVHYDRAEYWTIPTDGYGDCDDYAVTKRKDLLASGIAPSALRLAVVDTPTNVRHAVLTVSTDMGDLVLDNLTSSILPWNQTGFTWIEIQDRINPMQWDEIQPGYTATGDRRDRTAATAHPSAPH